MDLNHTLNARVATFRKLSVGRWRELGHTHAISAHAPPRQTLSTIPVGRGPPWSRVPKLPNLAPPARHHGTPSFLASVAEPVRVDEGRHRSSADRRSRLRRRPSASRQRLRPRCQGPRPS